MKQGDSGIVFSCAVISPWLYQRQMSWHPISSPCSSQAITVVLQVSSVSFSDPHSSAPPSLLPTPLYPDDKPEGPHPVWPYSDQWGTVCEQPLLPWCSLNNSYECAETPRFEVCKIWSMGNPHAQRHWRTIWPQFYVSPESPCGVQILWPVLDTSLPWDRTTPIWDNWPDEADWSSL